MRREKLFGRDLGVIFDAVQTGRKIGAGIKFWSALARSPELFRIVYRRVMAEIEFKAPRPKFQVTVDYGLSWALLFEAARCHVHDGWLGTLKIPALDPKQGKEEMTIELLWFYGGADRERICKTVEKLSYRFATVAETMAMLAGHPDAIWDLCQNTIVAPEYPMSPHEVTHKRQLLILGDIKGNIMRGDAATVHIADSDDPRWKDIWFGTHCTSNDVNYQWHYFVPVVRKQ